jgi:hypothetical protein
VILFCLVYYRASCSFRLIFITCVRVSCKMRIWVVVVYVLKFRGRLKVKHMGSASI